MPAADGEVIQLRRITEEFRPRGDLQRAAVESAVRTLAEQAQPGGVMRAPSESTPLRASAMRRARRLPEVEPLVVYHPREFWRKAFDLTWSESERGLDAGRKGRRRGWSEVHIGSYGQGLTE
ncbi:MAG: hypothetical protein KGJ03_13600, partial [Betaproteobacteria bacterium]|nr:hypothetical protein [Betaproteobacteria bacterium]